MNKFIYLIDIILEILKEDGYFFVSKKLKGVLGLHPAILYSELLSKFRYYADKEKLKDGLFFCTIKDLKMSTGLSKSQQAKAIRILINEKLIEQRNMGMPSKRYFKINSDTTVLENILSRHESKTHLVKKCPTRCSEIDQLDGQKVNTNNKKNNKTRNKDIIYNTSSNRYNNLIYIIPEYPDLAMKISKNQDYSDKAIQDVCEFLEKDYRHKFKPESYLEYYLNHPDEFYNNFYDKPVGLDEYVENMNYS